MKKIILFSVIALSLFSTKPVLAQNQMGQMQQKMREYLKDSVHLSDAMTDSVMAVRMQYQTQMRQIFADQSMSAEDKRSKMQSMRTEMETKCKAIGLTDDQITMMREHDQRMREQMRNHTNGGSGGQ